MISFEYFERASKKFVKYKRQQEAVEDIKRKIIDQMCNLNKY